jgi:hypothetical protein
MEELRGRPVLIEFWDFCRPNSMRTLPYLKAWHERYGGPPPQPRRRPADDEHAHDDGRANGSGHEREHRNGSAPGATAETAPAQRLQVIGIHSSGFEPSRDRKAVIAAVERLGIEYPVMIDSQLEMWREYENLGWPARYLFGPDGMLFHYHYGEGAYEETELAVQELLGLQLPPLPPLRPEDAPGATLARQSEDREGAYEGAYEAGGVWAVLDGVGTVQVSGGDGGGKTLTIERPGAYSLIEHERSTRGKLSLALSDGVTCIATCFTPGLA